MRNLSATPPRFVTLPATALLLALCWSPAAAAEPRPVGPDIRVGSDSVAACPSIAMSAGGDFEVVWENYFSYAYPPPQGIFARHFDRQGRPTQAAPIQLDSPDSLQSGFVNVVALPGSGYFVTWLEDPSSGRAIVGRFLSAKGRPRGPVLRLRRSGEPAGLAVVNGNLLLAWIDENEVGLRAQLFDLSGHPLGSVMRLSDSLVESVGLAPLADSFVVSWETLDWRFEAQRFSLTGEPLGAPQPALQSLGGLFSLPVASDGNDRFALGWTVRERRAEPQTGQQVDDYETRARFFDAAGASSPEVRPNLLFTGNQQLSGLAMNRNGLTLATWQSDRNYPVSSLDVVGRFLTPDGQPASKAFPLPQKILAGMDICAAAATNGRDDWAVAWLVWHEAIFARRLTSAD
jgi:hypothetical protein